MRLSYVSLLIVAGCGSTTAPQQIDAPPVCVPETDAAFCTRLAKTCEPVSTMDNCGTARTADCGTCSGATSVCVANVCSAPVCGSTFTSPGTPIASLNTAGKQAALLGASSTGQSVLFLNPTVTCVSSGGSSLTIGDEAVAGTPPYVVQNIAAVGNLAGFAKTEESMTLSSDGLTIIGVATGGKTFFASHRTAVSAIDFSLAAAGDYAAINTGVPAGGSVAWPVLSADGLAFYFQVGGATDTTQNGIYEAVRASTGVAFPAGTKMPGVIQTFEAVTGMSSDRMTAFLSMSFGTKILTRTSLTQPFTAPATSTPPTQAWRTIPIAGCTAIGTSEPGGCGSEQITTWVNH